MARRKLTRRRRLVLRVKRLWTEEPVMVMSALTASVPLATSVGMSRGTAVAVVGLVGSITRTQVSPAAKIAKEESREAATGSFLESAPAADVDGAPGP